jgi:phosphohistidine phosphatase
MLLYLVQHAEARSKEEDPARGLSEKGIQNITKVAQFVAKFDIKVSQLFHSGKTRAMQTARVLADYLRVGDGISVIEGLDPMDEPQMLFERISLMHEDIMLVGHLPHLAKFASLMLCGDEDRNIIDFKMGCVVCLERSDEGSWSVEWMITPGEIK